MKSINEPWAAKLKDLGAVKLEADGSAAPNKDGDGDEGDAEELLKLRKKLLEKRMPAATSAPDRLMCQLQLNELANPSR